MAEDGGDTLGGLDLSLSLSLPPHIYLLGVLVFPAATFSNNKVEETWAARKRKSAGGSGRRRMVTTADGGFEKELTASDVGHLSRLMLSKMYVNQHVLPFLSPKELAKVRRNSNGLRVMVLDRSDCTKHVLTLKRWRSADSYVLGGNWIKSFVKRKGLQVSDKIRLFWHHPSSTFHFYMLRYTL